VLAFLVRAEKLQYLQKWELANMEMLEDVRLGKNCGDAKGATPTFLCSIFLSISGAMNTVPLLQTVYQADAAHMNFGKYRMYSCYGITANCNAFPVVFGIIYGNEDKDGWERFWKFASTQHPCLNHARVTIGVTGVPDLIEWSTFLSNTKLNIQSRNSTKY
jgi:hypothetical protein